MRLAARFPFFGVLCLHAEHVIRADVETARTDGRRIEYGEAYCGSLDDATLTGVMLHEVLHCGLAHVPRLRGRDPVVWNRAADIVVNEVITTLGGDVRLPVGAIRDMKLAAYRTEEVYERLFKDGSWDRTEADLDLFPMPFGGHDPWARVAAGGAPEPSAAVADERFWKDALAVAKQMEEARGEASELFGTQGRGLAGAGLLLRINEQLTHQVDWRAALWEHVVRTPDDFSGFDRRLVAHGLYLEELASERLDVDVCVDTSGSISSEQLSEFIAELRGIVSTHERVHVMLYYADAVLHGPFELNQASRIPTPRGGGGTDFRPFFARVAEEHEPHGHRVSVYLTDGYGAFPMPAPHGVNTIWVVTPHGLPSARFPFGEVIRMVET